ncbi:unnamed protein product [Adineta steineri]|uniref:ALMS motif domain-containing protein n=1 Tax=Adineta steineri TaxID=433720 RepID=A0A815P868_9BILA|nr:unnamed protein product [Adineta steineri]CAF3916784.1 unnamed protein product [Adineta steineri]
MSESARTTQSIDQSPTSQSVEVLEEIVRNCQRNEERLHELERHTRHERKKAERLLQETFRARQDRESRTASAVDYNTTDDNSHVDDQKFKQRTSSKEFFVSLDDDDNDTNENHHRQQTHHSNKTLKQDKHLLARVEKLLAGDGTTTSSEMMSSQERQKRILKKPITPPIEDDLDEKISNHNHEYRHLPSACSIENDLSTVDRLLSERTPNHHHHQRIKSDDKINREKQTKKTHNNYKDENHKDLIDKNDQQFYRRLDNYVQTGRFVSPESETQTTKNEETSQYQSRPTTTKIVNKDEELNDLARRCENLLGRLHAERNRAYMLEKSTHRHDSYRPQTTHSSSSHDLDRHYHHRSISPTPSLPSEPTPLSLQQALELLRPEFISRSRQRARRVRLLREEREHNAEIDRERRQMLRFSCSSWCAKPSKRATSAPSTRSNLAYTIPYHQPDSSRIPLTYGQMKRATKKKYEQLPEVTDRRRQNQMDELRRRNYLRAKVFRTRLRQHVARHGRTNIDESLTMIET